MFRRQIVCVSFVSLAVCSAVSWYLRAAEEEAPNPKTGSGLILKKEKVEPADNSYCLVCHANYQGEELTKAHQIAGVGCEKCHGESIDHSGDEDGLIPPEKMYLKSEVTAYCETCHEKAKIIDREDHQKFYKEITEDKADKTCDECHGEKHRLNVRTRIWDKKTRKLLKDDGVRMMSKALPASAEKKPEGK